MVATINRRNSVSLDSSDENTVNTSGSKYVNRRRLSSDSN
ncbi:unnamed protein product [Schistosoma curassoni]|uniref:RNF111_N domain-containing protein n=1 Tax=Schistosoma curassoni TaxID=6186 RepID=A0A183JD51_9TREM|nr:unnamed protein product [Schistosoma curassoni]